MTTAERVAPLGQWYQHFLFPDGSEIGTWPTEEKCSLLTAGLELQGKSALDIACMSGAATLWLERAGAAVSACDFDLRCEREFAVIKQEFGMDAEFTLASVYDVGAAYQRRFDVALMMGLYYHLKHPLLGIERAWDVTGEVLLIEGEVSDKAGCSADFYEHEYLGDATNWWVPTIDCLLAWCLTLDEVEFVEPVWPVVSPSRMGVRVWRKQECE